MIDPIENQIQQLPRKQPSEKLDQQIEALFRNQRAENKVQPSRDHLQVDRRTRSLGSSLLWLASCSVCLFAGAFLGGNYFRNDTSSANEENTALGSSEKIEPGFVDWSLLEKAGLVQKVALESNPEKTEILDRSVWESEDGSLRETYLTVTKRKVLVVDQKNRKIFQMELNIPTTVVKEDPGI